MGLLLFLLGSLYLLLVAGFRYLQQAQALQTAHQNSLMGLRKVSQELAASNSATITIGTAPDFVAMLSPQSLITQADYTRYTYSGTNLEWKKWVCFYHQPAPAEVLMRAELELPAPAVLPPTPAPPALGDFQTAPAQAPAALHVTAFSVVPGSTPETFRVSLTVTKPLNSEKVTSLSAQSEVKVQN